MSKFYKTLSSLIQERAIILHYCEIPAKHDPNNLYCLDIEYIAYYPDEAYFGCQMVLVPSPLTEFGYGYYSIGFEDFNELTQHLFSDHIPTVITAKKTIEKIENYTEIHTSPITY